MSSPVMAALVLLCVHLHGITAVGVDTQAGRQSFCTALFLIVSNVLTSSSVMQLMADEYVMAASNEVQSRLLF